jgi:hypothetical protein
MMYLSQLYYREQQSSKDLLIIPFFYIGEKSHSIQDNPLRKTYIDE